MRELSLYGVTRLKKSYLVRAPFLVAAVCLTAAAAPVVAQELTITNARIIVRDGTVIEKGSIVVRDGKIVSVAAATSNERGQGRRGHRRQGMTAMAGFVDGHRHINAKDQRQRCNACWRPGSRPCCPAVERRNRCWCG
jgi:hypothetical protein